MRRIINGKTYDTKKSKLIYGNHAIGIETNIRRINNTLLTLSGERLTAAVDALTHEGNVYISYKLYRNHTGMYYAVIAMAVLRETKAVGDSGVKAQYVTEYIFIPIRSSKAEKIMVEIQKAGILK
mgnify:FL=1